MAWIRDTSCGQLVRYLTSNRLCKYPEEEPSFIYPHAQDQYPNKEYPEPSPVGDKCGHTEDDNTTSPSLEAGRGDRSFNESDKSIPDDSSDPEPTIFQDGTIVVGWYSDNDTANPKNWSNSRKLLACTCVNLYTAAVYMGSSIFTSSYRGVMADFPTVEMQLVTMGLSMYVLAYGLGPLLWSPLSEVPSIGRNTPYIVTFALFTLLLLPAALTSDSFAGLIVVRFLQGFFGSPCLATGGATVADLYSRPKLPYMMSMWTLFATTGPSLGPLLSGFSIPAVGDWRWSMWIMLWFSGPVWLLMFFCLPETNADTILLRRAQRLRKITGNPAFKSQSELVSQTRTTSPTNIIKAALWRPLQLMVMDPSIGFTAVYTALIYGIYYSFFEAFPLVYMDMYGLNLGEQGLVFLSITIGSIFAVAAYWLYTFLVVEPALQQGNELPPERRLTPALYSAFLLPAGLFMFAWTATPSVHIVVSAIGIAAFAGGILIILQCIFVYLELAYPKYVASLFAGNDLARSALAAATIHFSQPLYHDLGVARGVTLLGGLAVACIGGVMVLFFYGAQLRARSRFATTEI